MKPVILDIRNLSVEFTTNSGKVKAVEHIHFQLLEGETLGLVGESGSGKSVTAMLLMGLIPGQTATITSGEILYTTKAGNTVDILTLTENERCLLRGKELGMIFQEPATSLNPVMRCGDQITESLQIHLGMSAKAAKSQTLERLAEVQLQDPERIFTAFPHELSGGQKQRVMIAMAIACNPRVLIADEPTTALDVTVQKTILELLKELQVQNQLSIIFQQVSCVRL